MSAESELRALLVADAGVLAALGTVSGVTADKRISIDIVAPTMPKPYIVFGTQTTVDDHGLSGTLLATTTTIDVQCVGTGRANAITVRDAVRAVLRSAGMPADRGAAAYDGENDLEVEIVTVDWFDV